MLGEILDDLLTSPSTGPCITTLRQFPARPPVLVSFPSSLDPRLADALRGRGIGQLYSHQARAWELVDKGHHVVVVTPTASGKTLCYNLPVLFQNLRYVVIDELHAYRGVFGSHIANVIRRLKRLCRHYGSAPQFIMASATIANPRELAERIIGDSVEEVSESGAPTGDKLFLCYNPPVVNPELGIRAPYLGEAARLATRFLKDKIPTIVFAQSRLATEVLLTAIKSSVADKTGDAGIVRGYRGGYLPTRRRAVEQGLRSGEVLGVVSTNALELGVDIGHLDVAVLAGYPGTIASLWQQAGRAGRRSGGSAAVFVATSAPLDH